MEQAVSVGPARSSAGQFTRFNLMRSHSRTHALPHLEHRTIHNVANAHPSCSFSVTTHHDTQFYSLSRTNDY